MKPMTKSKLYKWGIGAGCTLTAALIFNQIKADPAFAIAQQQATAGQGGSGEPQAAAPRQDRVQQEFQQFRSEREALRAGEKRGEQRGSRGVRGRDRLEAGVDNGAAAPGNRSGAAGDAGSQSESQGSQSGGDRSGLGSQGGGLGSQDSRNGGTSSEQGSQGLQGGSRSGTGGTVAPGAPQTSAPQGSTTPRSSSRSRAS